MRKKRQKGFTLIEVLAALGIIIVLTLALVVTIRGQLERADRQNLEAAMATMNMQISVAYDQPGREQIDFTSPSAMAKAGILSSAQLEQAARLKLSLNESPPQFVLK
ncbi:type II secretion system protein [Lacticaseibacillus baoqingensis]|uniref:Type II secretion system protein n=1 Tax=Lacticaseibacillus baoqingensis TaxID=2486013 RepID=A0ABW4E5X9_9LACO|nr:type II secretion system protein [Lacticaseibacillus baoqingensis]